jgi:hypothetical protein
MHLEAVFKPVGTYAWRMKSSQVGDALAGRDRASVEKHIEAIIK